MNTQTQYRIYGKHETQRRFRPMDLSTGQRVVNLIYASILTADQVERFMTREAPRNPDWTFEPRLIDDDANPQVRETA